MSIDSIKSTNQTSKSERSNPELEYSEKRSSLLQTTSPVDETIDGKDLPTQSTLLDRQKKAEAKKEEGNVQFKRGNFSKAVGFYTEAIDLDGDNPAYLANRAAALMSLRNYKSALADMELVNSTRFLNVASQPNLKNIIRLVRCHLPLAQFYQARQALKNLLLQSPDCLEAQKEDSRLKRLELILTALQRDRVRKDWVMVLFGLNRLQDELDCGPLQAKDWIIFKIEALCGQKKWEEAKLICNELVRSCPSDPEALFYRAKVMYSQGNLAATISHCQEAVRCDPEFASAGNLLRQARNIESLKEAGNAAFKTCDFPTAIQKYVEAGSIDPTNQSILLTLDSNRAQALLKNSQYGQAVEVCDQILKNDPQHFKALRTRARARKAESDYDTALIDFEAASKLAPSSKEQAEIIKEIKSTKILIARGKYVDHYKILGVSRDASDEEIKKAFRKKSLIHHPDKGGNEEKFKEVNESYSVLQDPQSRRKFDMTNPDDPQGSFGAHSNGFGFGSMAGDEPTPFFSGSRFSMHGDGNYRTQHSDGFTRYYTYHPYDYDH